MIYFSFIYKDWRSSKTLSISLPLCLHVCVYHCQVILANRISDPIIAGRQLLHELIYDKLIKFIKKSFKIFTEHQKILQAEKTTRWIWHCSGRVSNHPAPHVPGWPELGLLVLRVRVQGAAARLGPAHLYVRVLVVWE